MPTALDDNLLKGYLLGELSEADQRRVEEAFFADAELYARLQAVKAELTDQYVGESLLPKQKSVFERRFLSTETGREDALFALALRDALPEEERQRQPALLEPESAPWWRGVTSFFSFTSAWKPAMALAMLILFAGSAWLFFERRRLLAELEGAERERNAARSLAEKGAALENQLVQANSQNRDLDEKLRKTRQDLDQARQSMDQLLRESKSASILGTVLSLVLAPSIGSRGADQIDEFVVLPEARTIRIQLLIEAIDNVRELRAEIRVRNASILKQPRLRRAANGNAVILSIPAEGLQAEIYEVNLYRGKNELLHTYDFKLSRRP